MRIIKIRDNFENVNFIKKLMFITWIMQFDLVWLFFGIWLEREKLSVLIVRNFLIFTMNFQLDNEQKAIFENFRC